MTDGLVTAGLIAVLVTVLVWFSYSASADCHKRGGELVKDFSGAPVCVAGAPRHEP